MRTALQIQKIVISTPHWVTYSKLFKKINVLRGGDLDPINYLFLFLLFFFKGHRNESCNLIGSLRGLYFPISVHGQQ